MQPIAEKMITLGRRGDLAARRQALAYLRSNDVVTMLFSDVAPRFTDRQGGYTRIVKLRPRWGDSAEMAYLELVDYVPPAPRPKRAVREEEPEEAELGRQQVSPAVWSFDSAGRTWATGCRPGPPRSRLRPQAPPGADEFQRVCLLLGEHVDRDVAPAPVHRQTLAA